jgi:hypothetical protein
MDRIVAGLAALAIAATGAFAAPGAGAETNIRSTTLDSQYFGRTGPFPFASLGITISGGGFETAGALSGFGTRQRHNTTGGTATRRRNILTA